jgi:hypothetical protein
LFGIKTISIKRDIRRTSLETLLDILLSIPKICLGRLALVLVFSVAPMLIRLSRYLHELLKVKLCERELSVFLCLAIFLSSFALKEKRITKDA